MIGGPGEPRLHGCASLPTSAITSLLALAITFVLKAYFHGITSLYSAMAAGFGVSISDLNLLVIYARQIHKALRDEGGSASEYQQAANELQSWLSVLEHIQ